MVDKFNYVQLDLQKPPEPEPPVVVRQKSPAEEQNMMLKLTIQDTLKSITAKVDTI